MLTLMSSHGKPVPIRDLELEWCRDRVAVVKGMIPKTEGHTCVDQPNLPCFPCDFDTKYKVRCELSLAPSGTVVCQIMLGDFVIETVSPGLYI